MCVAAVCSPTQPTRFFLQEDKCLKALENTKAPTGSKGMCVSVPEIVIGPGMTVTGNYSGITSSNYIRLGQ